MTSSPDGALASAPTELFIDGQWRPASDGARFEVHNPATGALLTTVASASVSDGDAALQAAHVAQAAWAATPPRTRSELLTAAFTALMDERDRFATLISLEMGKPLAESLSEVAYAAEYLRWFAEEAVRMGGRWLTDPVGGSRLVTMHKPVGPTLMVTPWNFPLAMGTRKVGPALAAGCTMVVKPAAQTPLTMGAFVELLDRVGVPAGVVNLIPTAQTAAVMEPLIRDPRARKLTFTGSTPIGRLLVEQSATQLLRVSMELGGNAPFIVFSDADVEAAVEGAVLAKMRNGGEACTAANRFLVHESVAVQFTSLLAARMGAIKVGSGLDPLTTLGPMIDAKAQAALGNLVTDAVSRGARVVCGGEPVPGAGWFFAPTVLADVPADAAVMTEEIFGPVAPVITFSTEAEAIRIANATEYGLASYIWTRSTDRAIRVSEKLEFGMVGVNTGVVSSVAAPFGGMKASGFGREGGFEGISEYLETTYVRLAVSEQETTG